MSSIPPLQSQPENSSSADENKLPCVLIIDDSRMMRVSLGRMLKKEFTILDAEDGEDGWEVLSANKDIQVVITDADMPVLNGYELITRIRNSDQDWIKDIPIIMITGAEEDHIREKALKTGATDFIVKPPDKTQLLARVRGNAKADRTTRKLSQEATLDALTKVSSRRYYFQKGMQDLAFAKRHDKDMSVITLALDNFTAIIKKYGPNTAKGIMVWTAEILKNTVRTEDTVARVGDFVFSIIAPNTSQDEAATVITRAMETIASTPYLDEHVSISLTASIGLSTLKQDSNKTIKDFLDTSLNRVNVARKAGGNQLISNDSRVEKTRVAEAAETVSTKAPVVETVVETTAEPVTETLDVNQALAQLDNDNKSRIPDIKQLVLKIFPLLELANKSLHWDLDAQLNAIKDKLNN